MISITALNCEEVARQIQYIPGGIEEAAKKAVRSTVKNAKKEGVRRAKARYTAPASVVTSSLTIKAKGMTGEIVSKGSANLLDVFKTEPKERITTRGQYMYAEVIRGQGAFLKRAFRKKKRQGIYERVGAERFPLKKLFRLSAPEMLSVIHISKPLTKYIEKEFSTNFEREADAILGGF